MNPSYKRRFLQLLRRRGPMTLLLRRKALPRTHDAVPVLPALDASVVLNHIPRVENPVQGVPAHNASRSFLEHIDRKTNPPKSDALFGFGEVEMLWDVGDRPFENLVLHVEGVVPGVGWCV